MYICIVMLEEAIKQKKFVSDRLRLAVNLYYTQSQLQYENNTLLKPFNLSVQQYNILRIVRGQKGTPISIRDITDRMIDEMSNASRLVEKMRKKGLVDRKVCPEDRRRVEIYLTREGEEILASASDCLEQQIEERLNVLTLDEVKQLNTLLDKING